ncbi:hypothetical protein ACOMHN_026623 [Nucella lapillus]
MALQYPTSPRHDRISPPSKFHPEPNVFHSADLDNEEEWFFNMKVHRTQEPRNVNDVPSSPRKQLDPVKISRKASREQTKSRDAAKPLFRRSRKLDALHFPSPAELKEQIDTQTARSIGDSLIFHNIPERCENTPEAEVVKFCQDYLVGRGIEHVQFGHVHKMEPRFSREAPIAARFSLILPPPVDQPEVEKYQPVPYIPPLPKRSRLPNLKMKSKKFRL